MASRNSNRWGLILLALVFLVCTGGFIVQSKSFLLQSAVTPQIESRLYQVETSRGEQLANKSIVGNCHLCHAYWVPIPRSEQTSNPRFAHANIQINHGNNDRCYNCHQITDRNNYVANDGSAIMVQTVEKLCSRCHGLIYNDWLSGTHGKWIGMWAAEAPGDQRTFVCTECHDPHDPAFKYEVTAPPPVWPDKFIRTQSETEQAGPMSDFLVTEKPEEIF